RDGKILLLDPRTGEVTGRLDGGQSEGWLALRWSPDGRRLIGGGYQSELAIWEVDGAGAPRLLPAMGLEVRALGWTADGARFFSADENGTVQLWTADGDHVLTLPTRNALVHGLFVLPDGDTLVVVNNTHPLVVYDPRPITAQTLLERRAWSRSELLRRLVDRAFANAVGPDEVAEHIRSSPAFEGLRTQALEAVAARGMNPNRVNSDVWSVVRYPGESREAVRLARARAEHYATRWPRWEFENTRAFARLRDGDPSGAAASARASMALGERSGVKAFPAERAILSLVACGAGELEAARAHLQQADAELLLPEWRHDAEARSIVDEARQMTAGRGCAAP
ncbi:MAG TPA: hypothetical protein PK095_14280, partial [Myxococcota bacterium]|nr:hypothetical protein [Myxococcota bacterium]